MISCQAASSTTSLFFFLPHECKNVDSFQSKGYSNSNILWIPLTKIFFNTLLYVFYKCSQKQKIVSNILWSSKQERLKALSLIVETKVSNLASVGKYLNIAIMGTTIFKYTYSIWLFPKQRKIVYSINLLILFRWIDWK